MLLLPLSQLLPFLLWLPFLMVLLPLLLFLLLPLQLVLHLGDGLQVDQHVRWLRLHVGLPRLGLGLGQRGLL